MRQRTDSEFQRGADSRRECVRPGHKGHSQFSERFGRGSYLRRSFDFRRHGIFATRSKTKSQAYETAGFSSKLNARGVDLLSQLARSAIGAPGRKISQEIVLRKFLCSLGADVTSLAGSLLIEQQFCVLAIEIGIIGSHVYTSS